MFTPTKPPVRNGIDGVVAGATQEDNMFYISITRMEVRGWIQFAPEGGGQRVSLQGDGWYDREFGGDAARGKGGDAVAVANVQWTWLGLQLSNGTEAVSYTHLTLPTKRIV